MKFRILTLSLMMIFVASFTLYAASKDSEDFKKSIDDYCYNVSEGKKIDTVAKKKEILMDLLTTEHESTFNIKFGAAANKLDQGMRELEQKSLAAKDEKEYAKYRNRFAELKDLYSKTRLIKEDFNKNRQIELNTGKKVEPKINFEISEASWNPEKETGEIKGFKKELEVAKKTINEALKALEKKDKKAFASLWNKKDKLNFEKDEIEMKQDPKRRGRSNVSRRFEKYTELKSKGGKVDLLPEFARKDLSKAAKKLSDKQVVIGAVRKWSKDRINVENIYLEKEDGKYKIKSWF